MTVCQVTIRVISYIPNTMLLVTIEEMSPLRSTYK